MIAMPAHQRIIPPSAHPAHPHSIHHHAAQCMLARFPTPPSPACRSSILPHAHPSASFLVSSSCTSLWRAGSIFPISTPAHSRCQRLFGFLLWSQKRARCHDDVSFGPVRP